LKVEGVVNGGMHAEEALGGASRLEPLHFGRPRTGRSGRAFDAAALYP